MTEARENEGHPNSHFSMLPFVDIIFASIGLFIAIITIQALLVRVEDKPAEADVYVGVAGPDALVASVAHLPDLEAWVRDEPLGLNTDALLALVGEIAGELERPVKLEIFHGGALFVPRFNLEKRLNEQTIEGLQENQAPSFRVAWRPIALNEDLEVLVQNRAENEPL